MRPSPDQERNLQDLGFDDGLWDILPPTGAAAKNVAASLVAVGVWPSGWLYRWYGVFGQTK